MVKGIKLVVVNIGTDFFFPISFTGQSFTRLYHIYIYICHNQLDDPLPFKIINTNIIPSVELIYININNGKVR